MLLLQQQLTLEVQTICILANSKLRIFFFSFLEVVYNPNEDYCLGSIEVNTAKSNCIKKYIRKQFDRGELDHMKMEYVILVDGIEQKI